MRGVDKDMNVHASRSYIMKNMGDHEIVITVNDAGIEFTAWNVSGQEEMYVPRETQRYGIGATRQLVGGAHYLSHELPDRLKKWQKFFPLLGESCTRVSAKMVSEILYDELELWTWSPGDHSWLYSCCPNLFKWLLGCEIEKRMNADLDEKRDTWMLEWYENIYSRTIGPIIVRRERLAQEIMDR